MHFFQDVDPATAPVVVWLQGGPGSSSMFGLFEIHGPISAVYDDNGDTTGVPNPWAWTRIANVIYIDQPVGTGMLSNSLGIGYCQNVLNHFMVFRFQLYHQRLC